jgi:hypothetical protein
MLGALARWSVPTVVTIALSARTLEAKASCPPCQKVTGNQCRACNINQILSCNCEPCLGPPYCSSSGALRAPEGGSSLRAPAPGSQGPGGASRDPRLDLLRQMQRERLRRRDPLSQPLYRDPFGVERRAPAGEPPGLYERLRATPQRRRM